MKSTRIRFMLLISVVLLAVGAIRAAEQDYWPDYMNPDCAIDERVNDLINRMTLEDKINQMETEDPPNDRLGLPGNNWWSESIHGVGRAGRATVFPVAIGLAATWDVDLMTRVATVISDEARAKHQEDPSARYHGLTYWAPSLDLVHDPRWGRIEETYGEDPYLVSRLGVAYIKAMQGNDPKYLKIAATAKHFAVHGQETDRHNLDVQISERTLREYYLAPFQAAFVEAKAASCMAAYNAVNEFPCSANHWLLTDLLRGEWGFDGAIVTDWGAPRCLRTAFKFVKTDEEAIKVELDAGVDVVCQSESMYCNFVEGLRLGVFQESQLDEALRRSLKLRFRLGMFDPPERVPYEEITPAWLGTPAHIELAREASRKAIVLLKNESIPGVADPTPILPLDRRKLESIAVIGSHANRVFLGNYSGQPAGPAITTYAGVTNHLSGQIIVRTVPWLDLDDLGAKKKKDAKTDSKNPDDLQRNIADAVNAAENSDVAVVVLGLNPNIEFEGRDRKDMDLPKIQQELIEKVVAVNPATVVILVNGSPLTIKWIKQHVPAIIEAWYPGEQGGNAIADVLFGDYNPAGRLPLTFYLSTIQLPPLADYEINLGRTYLYLPDPPLYPFGHGLSYTTFRYQNLRLDHDTVGTNGTVTVSLDVTNTGNRDGEEVVQLYVRDGDAKVIVPFKQLRRFQRIAIPSGATRSVSWPLPIAELGHWDEQRHGFFVEPGRFEVQVGASSADIRVQTMLRVQ